jgi:hypothetical protein
MPSEHSHSSPGGRTALSGWRVRSSIYRWGTAEPDRTVIANLGLVPNPRRTAPRRLAQGWLARDRGSDEARNVDCTVIPDLEGCHGTER